MSHYNPSGQINKMFSNVDGDKSGAIDKAEFARLYAKVGVHLQGRELDSQFRMYDTDNSGTISLEELQQHMHVSTNGRLADPDHHLRAVFKRFDENRDNYLDVRELAELYAQTGHHMDHREIENQMRLNGVHGGKVDFQAFKNFVSIGHSSGHHTSGHYT
jgi:Ca2+-binding EF-hand superfamily protein